jgi:hypothetical protein
VSRSRRRQESPRETLPSWKKTCERSGARPPEIESLIASSFSKNGLASSERTTGPGNRRRSRPRTSEELHSRPRPGAGDSVEVPTLEPMRDRQDSQSPSRGRRQARFRDSYYFIMAFAICRGSPDSYFARARQERRHWGQSLPLSRWPPPGYRIHR